MQDETLKKTLKECKKSADSGYKIASSQFKKLSSTVTNARDKIKNTVFDFESSPCYVSGSTEMLTKQLIDVEESLTQMTVYLKEDIESLRESLSDFSITLFGRTMAGKSTLMEILTDGDGSSIGKGAQRTTRDVRDYYWKNLHITDVPGIGAFEGEDDELIAFEAAKKADIVLFLLTDDGPQAVDAEFFGKIIALGKPVIGIINAKVAMPEKQSIKISLRDINKLFESNRLDEIHNQFLDYSRLLGQDWRSVPFVYVHLLSAFIAGKCHNKEDVKALLEVSRIKDLTEKIIEQVEHKGKYYRMKNFIDTVSVPMLNTTELLLNQSSDNSSQGRLVLDKSRRLEEWEEAFKRDSKTRIKSFITNTRSILLSEVATFTEEHFDDKNADKAWSELLKTKRIEEKSCELIEQIDEQCIEKITETSREISKELSFNNRIKNDSSLKMHNIVNTKKIWGWSTIIVEGGLSISGLIIFLVEGATAAALGPIGWAVLGVGAIGFLGSLLIGSKDKKEARARKNLEEKLKNSISRICDNMSSNMNKKLDEVVSLRITSVKKELVRLDNVLFTLADTQKELAWNLNTHIKELNFIIFNEALSLVDADKTPFDVVAAARIPGNSLMLVLKNDTVFPEVVRDKLMQLMSEYICFVHETDNKWYLITKILGKSVDKNSVSLEEKIQVAHLKTNKSTPILENKIRLAQQLSEYVIIKE